jgi:glutamate 5-kinase
MTIKKQQTLVVKLGTSVLTGGTKQLDRAQIVELIRQCTSLHQDGHKIIIVTSGAIAAVLFNCFFYLKNFFYL